MVLINKRNDLDKLLRTRYSCDDLCIHFFNKSSVLVLKILIKFYPKRIYHFEILHQDSRINEKILSDYHINNCDYILLPIIIAGDVELFSDSIYLLNKSGNFKSVDTKDFDFYDIDDRNDLIMTVFDELDLFAKNCKQIKGV